MSKSKERLNQEKEELRFCFFSFCLRLIYEFIFDFEFAMLNVYLLLSKSHDTASSSSSSSLPPFLHHHLLPLPNPFKQLPLQRYRQHNHTRAQNQGHKNIRYVHVPQPLQQRGLG